MKKEITYDLNNYEDLKQLLGEGDSNLKLLEEGLGIRFRQEPDRLFISGEESVLGSAVALIEAKGFRRIQVRSAHPGESQWSKVFGHVSPVSLQELALTSRMHGSAP